MTNRLAAGMTIAALFQFVGHWLPTSDPWNRPTVSKRIWAYTWGVTGIILGLFVATDKRTTSYALATATAAGAATVGAYALDSALRNGRND